MNTNDTPLSDLDPVDRACRVDSICDAFEAAWREGRAPRIEDYLNGPDAAAQRELLDALFAVEFSYRAGQGETPRVEDYHDRFPADLERFALIARDVAKDRTVAHYQVLQRLGIGSFASVYLALDTRLRRTVALKLSHGHWSDRAEAIFTREAKAAAQLDHPHIVPVFDFGRHDDTMFIAAQHVPGPSLKEWQHGRTVSWDEAAVLCARLAAAVHHAHQRGVIHRDLKPANIIIDPQGEPHITDFGLAKWADDATLTGSGDLKGTPAYMSPEQARGNSRDVTIQSDVYALGVILYELLTASRPFDGAVDEVIRRVMTEVPRPPRQLNAAIPRDLEIVCLKALAKEPQQRYATANDLAADLRRVTRGEPIEARPVGLVSRFLLWGRREPRLAAATVATAVLLVALAGGAWLWSWSLNAARNEAENSAAAATSAEIKALQEAEAANRLAAWLAQLIEATDSTGFQTTEQAGPPLAGFALGREAETPDQLGDLLDSLAGAVQGRLLDRPQVRARLLEALANGYRGLGRAADALPLYRETIALRQRIPDERTRRLAIADAEFHLAWLNLETGNGGEAKTSFEQVAATRSQLLGSERHPAVLAARAGILAAMMAEDDSPHYLLEDGWRLLLKLRVEGGDSLALAAIHDIPDVRQPREPKSAEELRRACEVLLASAHAILGDDHPVLAVLLIDAAGVNRKAGDYHRADQLLAQALPMARKFFGAHPKLVAPLREFAADLADRGDFDQALEAYREALRIADRQGGDHHALRAELLLRIGELYLQSGDCRRAAEKLAEALDVLGPSASPAAEDHLRDSILLNLAEAHANLGALDAARPYAAELLKRADDLSSPAAGSSRAASALLLSVADLLRKVGRRADADRLDEGALQLAEKRQRAKTPPAPDECAWAADVFARRQRWADSLEMLERALAGERLQSSAGQPIIARRCREVALALIHQAEREYADDPTRSEELLGRAQQLLTEAVMIRQRTHGAESHYVAELLLDGAHLQLALGRWAEARAEAIRALEHRRRLHDGPHIFTARTLLAVGRLLADVRDTAGAARLSREGQGLLKKLLPPTHAELLASESELSAR